MQRALHTASRLHLSPWKWPCVMPVYRRSWNLTGRRRALLWKKWPKRITGAPTRPTHMALFTAVQRNQHTKLMVQMNSHAMSIRMCTRIVMSMKALMCRKIVTCMAAATRMAWVNTRAPASTESPRPVTSTMSTTLMSSRITRATPRYQLQCQMLPPPRRPTHYPWSMAAVSRRLSVKPTLRPAPSRIRSKSMTPSAALVGVVCIWMLWMSWMHRMKTPSFMLRPSLDSLLIARPTCLRACHMQYSQIRMLKKWWVVTPSCSA